MKKLFLTILSLLLTLSITAGTAESFTITPPTPAKVEFALSSNPTTGFQWFAHLIKDGVVELADPNGSYVSDATDPLLCGSGGTQYFTLSAIAPGETILVLDYMRPFAPANRTTEAYLIVVDAAGQLHVQDLEGAAPLFGTVLIADITDHSALVLTESGNKVWVNFEEAHVLPVVDEEILVWFNGGMTVSLPARINAMGWETIASEPARPTDHSLVLP